MTTPTTTAAPIHFPTVAGLKKQKAMLRQISKAAPSAHPAIAAKHSAATLAGLVRDGSIVVLADGAFRITMSGRVELV